MTGPSSQALWGSRRFLPISVLLLLTLNLFVFLPSMKGDFLWDDKYFISENQDILSPGFLKRFLFSPFGGMEESGEYSPRTGQNRQFYRPLTSFSYWLDFKAWGLNPASFHLTNILLHFLNAVVLLCVLLGLGFGRPISLAGALLFSVFPVHFENVAWISGRTDLLSFLFAALSLLFFLQFIRKSGFLRLAGSSLFYLAALLSKENVILLPLLCLLLLLGKRRTLKEMLFPLLPFVLGFLAWAALRYNALGSAELSYSGRTLPEFLGAIGFYTWKMVFPFHLSVTVHPSPVLQHQGYRIFGLSLVFLLALFIFLVVKGKGTAERTSLTIPAYFLFLLPSAAVIFSAATISLMAWRFLYLPSVVFVSGLALVLFRKVRRQVVSAVLLVFLIIAYAAAIFPKNALYGRDETNFWLGIADLGREDLIVRFNTGIKYLPLDEGKALDLFEGILREKNHPLYGMWRRRVCEELAIYFAFQKDFDKAEQYFQELAKSPSGLSLHATFNYAYYFAFSGREEEGKRIVLEKLEAFPRDHFILTRAAKFYLIIEDYDKAAALYRRAYEIFPSRQTQKLIEELRGLQEKTKEEPP